MPEKSGFFDAIYVNGTYDRVYNADSFADYFSSFISNGVFAGKEQELLVTSTSPAANMSVTVLPGRAYIKGYWYQTTETKVLSLAASHSTNSRIDSVVVRLDNNGRTIGLAIVKGENSTSPVPPTLSSNEIQLATINVSAGKTVILNSDITDTRWDKNVCGAVGAIVNQIDTSDFYNQVNELCNYYYGLAEGSYNTYLTRLQDLIEVMEQTIIEGDLSALQIEVANKMKAPYKNISSGFVYEDENDDVYLVPPNGLGGEVQLFVDVDFFEEEEGSTAITLQQINVPIYRKEQKCLVFLQFDSEIELDNANGPMTAMLNFNVEAFGGSSEEDYPINIFWPQSIGEGTAFKNSHTFCFSFERATPGIQGIFIRPSINITNGTLTSLKCKVKAITLNHSSDTTSAMFTTDGQLVVTSNGQYISPRT